MDDENFLELFVVEVGEHLESLKKDLLTMEEDRGQPETVNSLMRAAHTIKGAAMLMSFDPMAKLAHAMEDRLRQEMKLERPVPSALIDLLLAGARTMGAMLDLVKARGAIETIEPQTEWADLGTRIRDLKVDDEAAAPPLVAKPPPAPPPVPAPPASPAGTAAPAPPSEAQMAADLEAALASAGSKSKKRPRKEKTSAATGAAKPPPGSPSSSPSPPAPASAPGAAKPPPGSLPSTSRAGSPSSPPSTAPIPPTDEHAAEAASAEGAAARTPSKPGEPAPSAVKEQIKISVEKVDQLNDLVGELLIYQAKLEAKQETLREITRRLDNLVSISERARLFGLAPLPPGIQEVQERLSEYVEHLSADLAELNYLAAEIRGRSLQIRMLPAHTLLQEFRLAVRDLKRRLRKEAELVIEGGDIELDKRLLEELRPAILHIVRNCMDHGIESPQDRVTAGKPAAGSIKIAVRIEGARVYISVEDDGRGMNADRIRKRAVDLDLISAETASTLTDEEALYLIMQPGFSTSEQVTDISGRGVGMDVVRTQVEDLKGTISIETTVGRGTRILLDLPLALSTAQVLMVEVAEQIIAIPIGYVEETLLLDPKDVYREGGKPVFRLRDRTLSLYVMHDYLVGLEFKQPPQGSLVPVILLHGRGQRVGFQVNRFLEQAEVVVKTLGTFIDTVAFISGATILGDGRPALILDVPDLLSSLAVRRASSLDTGAAAASSTPGARRAGRVLVVDDSITTRALEKGILEAQGFRVLTASNAQEALDVLGREPIDLVLTDIDMPGIDGFEFTRRLRLKPEFTNLPVVICSSKSSDDDRMKGLQVGAQAYIVKRAFDQERPCSMVQRLIR